MLYDTYDHDTLYAALERRDPAFEGRAYVAVTSTGIFCRLTCPARNPKSENCRFFETVGECIEAGFRPCKRCRPLAKAAEGDPGVTKLMAAFEAEPERRWTEADIVALGLDPSTVRRGFKRQFGMTFLEMARLSRLRDGFVTLSGGGRVIDAQLDAGFDSPSGFRAAFARLLGQSPRSFTGGELLKADWIDSPIGALVAVSDRTHLHLLEFVDRKALPRELKKLREAAPGGIGIGRLPPTEQIAAELAGFFAGEGARFETPLAYHGSPFTREVWLELQRIPAGETRSYGDLAKAIGRPSATRAVARANGANQIAIAIPCHRVIGADGSLTGYGGGLWRKRKLIDLEQSYATKGKEKRHVPGNQGPDLLGAAS
ncbi:trifunctional transcriptional activator/DNA repair protein Ada/methylated-DNA--[protein]-cysteine S-methyltransferase [Nisaea acidiphila]|uniref:methylated-DNA--[protein]-cysteine S-methyltransferase n=1 Tax=Nisaea acidiphila TaxID=1862145 RepID=A0A9J7B1H5_9PROT|nr:trifunctional transcriptional activator/DNA repair protein Ada/methylated-DNA--[protein]-cysteine S-methyltransferase [Nisaea acidiphila]UUX51517.1 trifunctional transcriptional activator/DNA repair protein Ada/methylated-DNA--[protein]-cysteine S-methyltransferase [Nisaea acidiphila]